MHVNIPRRIFAIWLSEGSSIPEVVKKCLASQHIPGYEHRLITLGNCFKDSDYIRQALSSRHRCRWVKASDYLRLYYLLTEGGIYLDTDAEVLPGKDFEPFLGYRMFMGREYKGWTCNHLIGAEKGYPFIESWMRKMEADFRGDDERVFETGIELATRGYWEYGAGGVRTVQEFMDGVVPSVTPGLRWYKEGFGLFSPEYFCPWVPDDEKNPAVGRQRITPNTVVVHHNMNSWQ